MADLRSLASPGTIAAIDAFIGDLAARVQTVSRAFDSGDLGEVHRLVHGLKGSAGCLGAVGLMQALSVVEKAAQNGDRQEAWSAWRRAQPVAIASSAAFRNLVTSLKAGRAIR